MRTIYGLKQQPSLKHFLIHLSSLLHFLSVPTQFLTIHVLKNLNVNEEEPDNRDVNAAASTIENLKRHVIGTQTSDLSQIYNGQVVIRGSLVVKELKMLSTKTRIVVNDKDVPLNITGNYFMRNVKQEVQAENFVMKNQQIRTASIVAGHLNEHPANKFIMLDGTNAEGFTNLRFENAVIAKDLKGHRDNFPSLLFHLNQTTISRRGPPGIIFGSVNFREKLTVRQMSVGAINEHHVKDLIHANRKQIVVTAAKTVGSLELSRISVDEAFGTTNFNDGNLQAFATAVTRIDQPIELEALKVQTFEAKKLSTLFFEDHQLNEFLENLEKELKLEGGTAVKRNVKIFGNVDFQSNIFIDTINQRTQFNEFVNLMVPRNADNAEVGGRKTFQRVIASHLKTKLVQQFPMHRLLYQSLSRGEEQKIAGEFFAKSLQVKHLRTKMLNAMMWDQLVDKTRLESPLRANLNVAELEVKDLESKSSSFDLSKMLELAQFPKRVRWEAIAVEKFVEFPLNAVSLLDRIVMSAVRKSGSQTIAGSVLINTEKLYIKQLLQHNGQVIAKGNPVDLHALFFDSVKKESKGLQIVGGLKTFLSPIYIVDLKVADGAYFHSKEINNVDILNLNRTILRPGDVIRKAKKFTKLHADVIELKGLLNGIAPGAVVRIGHRLPTLHIKNLEVITLKTFTFDDYSFGHFLKNRMRLFYGSEQDVNGLLTFNALNLLNDTVISSINGVSIDDAIFHNSNQWHDIVGHKTVLGNITVIGPATIRNINSVDFEDFLRSSKLRHQNQVFDVLELSSITAKQGLTAKSSINGHHIEDLLHADAHTPKLNDLRSSMSQVEDEINELNLGKRERTAKQHRLLYIDYDPDVQIAYKGSPKVHNRCSDNVIDPSKFNTITVREKRESEMSVEMPSATITVKPNFVCHDDVVHSKELNVWWAFKSSPNETYFRNFSLTSEVSDVKFVETRRGVVLMILVLQDRASQTGEVAVLQLNVADNDWHEHQPKIPGLNFVTRLAVVDAKQHQYLVVSTFDEASPPTSDYVTILLLNPVTEKFESNQKKLQGDRFDILLSINVSPKSRTLKPRTFLLLSRERSKSLYIYRLNDGAREFTFQLKVPFDSEIMEVVTMNINNDSSYFIVSLQNGEFLLFEWRGIESWKILQRGFFSNIKQIKSYEYLKRQHLFLASTLNTATALTIYRRGEIF